MNLIWSGQGGTSGFGVTHQPDCGLAVLPWLYVQAAPVTGPGPAACQHRVPTPSEGHLPGEAVLTLTGLRPPHPVTASALCRGSIREESCLEVTKQEKVREAQAQVGRVRKDDEGTKCQVGFFFQGSRRVFWGGGGGGVCTGPCLEEEGKGTSGRFTALPPSWRAFPPNQEGLRTGTQPFSNGRITGCSGDWKDL